MSIGSLLLRLARSNYAHTHTPKKYKSHISCAALSLCLYVVLPSNGLAQNGTHIKPSLNLTTEYNDNIYQEPNNHKKDADLITSLSAGATIKSAEGKNNSIEGNLKATQQIYTEHDDNNNLDYYAGLKLNKAITPSLNWKARTHYSHTHSNRGDNQANPSAVAKSPMATNIFSSSTSIRKTYNGLNLTPRLSFQNREHKNGTRFDNTPINRAWQDRYIIKTGLRLGYKPDPINELYTDIEHVQTHYQHKYFGNNDSAGNTYLIGWRRRPSEKLYIDLAAGYTQRNYKQHALENIETPAARARLRWQPTPTQQIDARLNYGNYINESSQHNVGGVIPTSLYLRYTHALTSEFKAWLRGQYNRYKYQGGHGADNGKNNRVDHVMRFTVGNDYALSQTTQLSLIYEYSKRTSNVALAEYERNIIRLGLNQEF